MPPASCTAPPPPSAPAGAGMGQVAGYTAADYLIQHASRERRSARVPASTWDAVLSYIRDPADAARLADSARAGCCTATPSRCTVTPPTPATGTPPGGWPNCWPSAATWTRPSRYCAPGPTPATGLPPIGWPSCWPSAATWTGCAPGPTPARGMPPAAGRAAGRARRPGRGCAPGPTPAMGTPPGSWPGCWPSAATWTGRADAARRADAGDGAAARRLAGLLAERGDLDGPTGTARPGRRRRRGAAERLAGCWPSAATWTGCAPGPTPATGHAALRLAELLAERGDLDGLRARADAGDGHAAMRLADLLAERGDLDEAERCCAPGRRRRRATPPRRLAGLLAERGDLDGLRARADAGDGPPPGGWPSCWPSAATWTSCAPGPTPATGTPPGGWPGCWPSAATWTRLRARADAGDEYAAWRLAELLAERGDLDEAARPGRRRRARASPSRAAGRAAGRARRPGRAARPGRRRRGLPPGGWPSCWPSAVTWTGCAPGPTPATGLPPAAGRGAD